MTYGSPFEYDEHSFLVDEALTDFLIDNDLIDEADCPTCGKDCGPTFGRDDLTHLMYQESINEELAAAAEGYLPALDLEDDPSWGDEPF